MPLNTFIVGVRPHPPKKTRICIDQQACAVKYRSEVVLSIQCLLTLSFVRFLDHQKAQNLAVAGKSRDTIRLQMALAYYGVGAGHLD